MIYFVFIPTKEKRGKTVMIIIVKIGKEKAACWTGY